MGKASAPAAPNYAPIANSSLQAAQLDAKTQASQLDWAKQEFASQEATAAPVIAADVSQQNAETKIAQDQENTYNSTYLPIEKQFAGQATNYDSADQANQMAGAADASVATSFDQQRSSALSSLESYGIDPSQTRNQALDTGTRVQQAAATAAAGTQSRLNTQATGLALEGDAINTGRGYAANVSQSYSGALGAGSGAVSTGLNTGLAGNTEMGNATTYGGLANSANSGATSALNAGYSNQLSSAQLNEQEQANLMSGIGGIIGSGASALGSFYGGGGGGI